MSKTNKSKIGCLTIMSAAVIAAGGAYFTFRILIGKELNPIEAAKLVPQKAVMAAYIDTDPQNWSKLEQFGTPEAQTILKNNFKELSEPIEDANISYEKDIAPWLGGVMLAMLPPEKKEEPETLILIGVKNKLEALKFVNKIQNDKEYKFQESKYQGISITEAKYKNEESSYSAFINDQLVIAPDREAIESSIDTFRGEPSFATKSGSQDILTRNSNLDNPLVQIYLPDYASFVQQAIETSEVNKISPQTLQQLKNIESMIMGIGVNDKGINVRAIASINPKAILPKYEPVPDKLLTQFPHNTIALISGGNINETWSWFVKQAEEDSEIKPALNQWRETMSTGANLDLDKDIFSWMDDEFAIGIIPTKQNNFTNVNLGGMLMWTTTDRQSAERMLEKIEKAIIGNLFISSKQIDVDSKQITEWRTPDQKLMLAYGWLNDNSLLMTIGSSVDEIINIQPKDSLPQSDRFKEITSNLPKSNYGYFYLNFEEIAQKVNYWSQTVGQPIPSEAEAFLNSITGVAFTANMPDRTTSQVDMLFSLKANNLESR
jgi:Protein of unknown function (DUF3352)